jgi:hypothetical protein
MSTGFNYLPKPPRAWSRVQYPCSTNTDNSSDVYVPIINKTISTAEANYLNKMYNKGNVLQYKKNSSQLTKSQKYSQISKGMWVCKKSYATQSTTYTNPNTTSLLRVNYSTIPFPNTLVGYPNNISGPFQYDVANPFNCSTTDLQDGGNLVCNAIVSPCTGVVTQTFTQENCYPTTCSDVPGKIEALCWNPKIQTWFTKQNTTMNNSGNKWPQGYKGFVSAVKLASPTLSYYNINSSNVSLSWSSPINICAPITNYKIYINDILSETVSYTVTSTTIYGLTPNTQYSFYVISMCNTLKSDASNTITVTTSSS